MPLRWTDTGASFSIKITTREAIDLLVRFRAYGYPEFDQAGIWTQTADGSEERVIRYDELKIGDAGLAQPPKAGGFAYCKVEWSGPGGSGASELMEASKGDRTFRPLAQGKPN